MTKTCFVIMGTIIVVKRKETLPISYGKTCLLQKLLLTHQLWQMKQRHILKVWEFGQETYILSLRTSLSLCDSA